MEALGAAEEFWQRHNSALSKTFPLFSDGEEWCCGFVWNSASHYASKKKKKDVHY